MEARLAQGKTDAAIYCAGARAAIKRILDDIDEYVKEVEREDTDE